MNPWHDISLTSKNLEILNAFIEIPMHSKIKYEIDKNSGYLCVDRILASSFHYPYNYGFFPQTLSEDEDPLDVLVMGQLPVTPQSLMQVKPIGVIHMQDQGKRDDKILSIHTEDPEFNHIKKFSDLPNHYVAEIAHFFKHYKELENKTITITDIGDEQDAWETIKKAQNLYHTAF